MIIALCWQIRPYYRHEQWQELREGIQRIAFDTPVKDKCSQLIKKLLEVSRDKIREKAQKYWLPMDYRISNPAYQNQLRLLASSYFSDQAGEIQMTRPDDAAKWLALKNSIERFELFFASLKVPDDTDDPRPALDEANRWAKQTRPYQECIDGIDWLEPTSEIDFESEQEVPENQS